MMREKPYSIAQKRLSELGVNDDILKDKVENLEDKLKKRKLEMRKIQSCNIELKAKLKEKTEECDALKSKLETRNVMGSHRSPEGTGGF